MITETERAQIKTILGHRYAEDVKDFLFKSGFRNKNGYPHSTVQIRQVMNGGQSHPVIEDAIIVLTEEKDRHLTAAKQKKLNLLKKIKTNQKENSKAATSEL